MILKVHYIGGLLLLSAWPVLAGAPHSLTLPQVIAASLADNAPLHSLNQKAGAMGERSREAGSLSNPMLTYRGMDSTSGGQWPDTEEKRLEIEQAFPWPGKRGLKQTMASKDAEAVQSEVRVLALDVELSAAEAFYALHAARQSVALIRDEAALLRRIESLAAVRYTTGRSGNRMC